MTDNAEIAQAYDLLGQKPMSTIGMLDIPPPAVDAPAREDETGVELKRGAFLNTIAMLASNLRGVFIFLLRYRPAARNSARLRARLPVACERAIKVVMALSSPKTAILLARSVFAQATENVPKAAGPRSRATRKMKDAAKVRRQHRDRVQEGAAFELYSGFVYARWRIRLPAAGRRAYLPMVLIGFSPSRVIGLAIPSVIVIRHEKECLRYS